MLANVGMDYGRTTAAQAQARVGSPTRPVSRTTSQHSRPPRTPVPTFTHDLTRAAQLDLLETLTRAALTEHYGLDGEAATVEVQQYEDNAVWRITPSDRDSSFVARLSVRGGRPAYQQRSEMRWLESLAAARTAAVPEPLATTSGHYVVPIEIPDHDEPAPLARLHWLPGAAEPPYRQPGITQEMSIATAHLHQHAATVPLPEFDRPVWDAETILLNGPALTSPGVHEHLGAAGTATLRKVTELTTPALQEGGPGDRRRMHGDLHPGTLGS
ncbi:phosphotransferase enzyme family protein [Streptomyces sp. NPDC002740]